MPFAAWLLRALLQQVPSNAEAAMTIGTGIALIIVGLILAFGLEFELEGLNIDVIGYILIVGGVIGLIFGLTMYNRRRTTIVERSTPVREREVIRDRDVM
jgi:uncharacterized protein YacL